MATKAEIRERVWRAMTEAGVALFPGAPGRIPNFVGAAQAAEHVARWEPWRRARVLKCNPDLPQLPLRRRALAEGKVVYLAVPRLAQERCFLELDPARLANPSLAATIRGAFKLGRPVHPREVRPVDLIVCGAVAVRPDGARLGKGGGFSDLEYALLRTLGLVAAETPVVTTVHPLQVWNGPIPMARNDIVLGAFATPYGLVPCQRAYPRPEGVYWGQVGEKLAQVPALQDLLPSVGGGQEDAPYQRGAYAERDGAKVARTVRQEGSEPLPIAYPPGRRYPPHTHTTAKLLAFLRGSMRGRVGEAWYACRPGDRLLIPGDVGYAAEGGTAGCVFPGAERLPP